MSDKEQMAILRLREASEMSLSQYKKPLLITSSGGKDSSVCVELARRAGIPFEVLHNNGRRCFSLVDGGWRSAGAAIF